MDASVRSFSRDEVLRMLDALKQALSSTMRVVESEMALSAPPITPASAIAPSASAITRFEGSSRNVSPFSAASFSPARAERTKIAAAELVGIEGVHRLRKFRHDEIGDVDDIVDRVQADRFQAILQPQRRRLDGDIFKHQRGVARAQQRIFAQSTSIAGAAHPEVVAASPDRATCFPRIAATSRAIP